MSIVEEFCVHTPTDISAATGSSAPLLRYFRFSRDVERRVESLIRRDILNMPHTNALASTKPSHY